MPTCGILDWSNLFFNGVQFRSHSSPSTHPACNHPHGRSKCRFKRHAVVVAMAMAVLGTAQWFDVVQYPCTPQLRVMTLSCGNRDDREKEVFKGVRGGHRT